MKTEFKSAEEFAKEIRAASQGDDYYFYSHSDTLIPQIQSNTMREAARIAVHRMSPMTIPDEFIDRVEAAILEAAIAIEKGEHKAV